jgi:hypothetical protein
MLGLLAAMGACGEFPHSNPVDPVVPVTLKVVGPDSSYAQFDTLRFSLETSPEFDHEAPLWEVQGILQKVDDLGTYEAPQSSGSGEVTTAIITARLGSRRASKSVVVTYWPRSFRVTNCTDGSDTLLLENIIEVRTACTELRDVRGGLIAIAPPPLQRLPTATSLDTSIVRVTDDLLLWPLRNGTARIEYSQGGFYDTLTVVVRQTVAYLTPTPTACWRYDSVPLRMPLGTSMQLTIGAPGYDVYRSPVVDSALVQSAIDEVRWVATSPSDPVSVTPNGLVTARSSGATTITAEFPGRKVGSGSVAFCSIVVQ